MEVYNSSTHLFDVLYTRHSDVPYIRLPNIPYTHLPDIFYTSSAAATRSAIAAI